MKYVLFVVPNDYERIGGIRLPVLQYINALESKGVKVVLKMLSYHPRKFEIEDVILSSRNCSILCVYGLNQAYSMIKYLRKHRDKVIFKKTFALLIDSERYYAFSVLKTINPIKQPHKYLETFLKYIVYKKKEEICLNNYSDALYVSNVDKTYVDSHYKKIKASLHVIENGIIPPNSIRKRTHNYNAFRIGFLSSYTPSVIEENLKPIVEELMPIIISNHPSTRLVVAGRGSEEFLESYVKKYNYIEYMGPVDSLDSFYDSVDIVIPLTLKKNGILNKILEAWSYGKCVIAYDYNFYSFMNSEKDIHYLCGSNLSDISKIVKDVIDQRIDIDIIGMEAREVVFKYYLWENKKNDFYNMIIDCLEKE